MAHFSRLRSRGLRTAFELRLLGSGFKPVLRHLEEANIHNGRSFSGCFWHKSCVGRFSPWKNISPCFPHHVSVRFMNIKTRVETRKKRDLAHRTYKQMRRRMKEIRARMTPEEKLIWRLRKSNRKKGILLQRLKKLELEKDPEPVHDPELITPEQLQSFKKIGYKNRNYVPVGRRGVYGGVVLNMHMHWKFHETVQIDCHIYKRDDVRTVARELARLSGGIVIDIHQKTNIIMYRGRNYRQPKKEMTPVNTLTKRKALFKATYLQSLESINKHIEEMESQLRALKHQEFKLKQERLQSKQQALNRKEFIMQHERDNGNMKSGGSGPDKEMEMEMNANKGAVPMDDWDEEIPTSDAEDKEVGGFDWESDSVDDEDKSLSDGRPDDGGDDDDKMSEDVSLSESLTEDELLDDDFQYEDELSDEEDFNYGEAERAHLERKKHAAKKEAWYADDNRDLVKEGWTDDEEGKDEDYPVKAALSSCRTTPLTVTDTTSKQCTRGNQAKHVSMPGISDAFSDDDGDVSKRFGESGKKSIVKESEDDLLFENPEPDKNELLSSKSRNAVDDWSFKDSHLNENKIVLSKSKGNDEGSNGEA